MMSKRLFFALLLATLPGLAAAMDDLALASLESGKAATLEQFLGSPLLVTFWRSDCAPCVTEQPILRAVAAAHPDLPIAIISLQDAARTRKAFASVPDNMHVLLATGDAVETLHALGDKDLAMPYSVFMHADGSICGNRVGLLGTHIVDDWMKRC